MNRTIVTVILVIIALAAGAWIGISFTGSAPDADGSTGKKEEEKEILYWVAPMNPSFKSDKPGKSPMGMDLVPVYKDAGEGDGVRINPAVQNNLGVRTAEAEVRPLWRRIEATGIVGFNETLISHITVRVQGWIVRLRVDTEGERVKKGDLLFELYSPELVNAQKEYLQASKRGGDRLLAGADEKLRALGMIPQQIKALASKGVASEKIEVVAPQDGVVVSLGVREGMYVQPNTSIMSLADLSSVWLQAEVFESQADWVAKDQAAEALLSYLPGTVFSGQVDYIYPVLDPKTRTLGVRLRFDNPDERLKPNMYAKVSIYGRLKPNALSVPREAVIRSPRINRIVVALGDGQFEVREVMTGLESGEFVEVLAGITAGDEVVTSAQFLIDSEASLAGSIRRLESMEAVDPESEIAAVFASGQVEAVELSSRRLKISHGPIDALGWPSMTMEFPVQAGVNLSQIKPGQEIRVALVQEHAGEYVIEQVFSDAAKFGEKATVQANPRNASSDSSISAEGVSAPRFAGRGVVRKIMRDERSVKLEHEAIAELDWPAMTMNFEVMATVDLEQLKVNDQIHFSLQKTSDDGFVIDQIHIISSDPGLSADEDHKGMNHD